MYEQTAYMSHWNAVKHGSTTVKGRNMTPELRDIHARQGFEGKKKKKFIVNLQLPVRPIRHYVTAEVGNLGFTAR